MLKTDSRWYPFQAMGLAIESGGLPSIETNQAHRSFPSSRGTSECSPASSTQPPERPTPTEPAVRLRLRTVTGNRFPASAPADAASQSRATRKSATWSISGPRGRTQPICASTRLTTGATTESPALARTGRRFPDSPRRANFRARPRRPSHPRLRDRRSRSRTRTPRRPRSPEAGRPWASGQLVFNAGQFESARSGFADYAKDGETGEQLRTRVNRIILEDLEQKVLALRALHAKLRDVDAGESFAGVVARSRPA